MMPQIDPKDIYLHARGFDWSNEVLRSKRVIHQQSDLALAMHASAVLSAFASELYLKCLICLRTGQVPERVHNLKRLFEQIDPAHQSQIETMWNFMVQEPAKVQIREMIKDKLGEVVPTDLAWNIDVSSDAFVEMRYLYEPQNAETKFMLCDFPKLLKPIIFQVKPEWELLQPKLVTVR